MMSSTLMTEDAGVPFHVLQAEQIRLFREAWAAAGHQGTPRVSVSRSIFALVDDRDRAYFGRGTDASDKVGYLDAQTKAIFGRSYAAEPDVLVKELAADTAIQAADTLLLTVPNQLGVDYNAHAMESILKLRRPGPRLAVAAASAVSCGAPSPSGGPSQARPRACPGSGSAASADPRSTRRAPRRSRR